MFEILISIVPVSAALFCLLQNIFLSPKTSTFPVFQFLLFCVAVFLLADSLYVFPGISNDVLSYARMVKLFVAPSLVPLAWMYLNKVNRDKRFAPVHYLWLVLPVFSLILGLLLHFLAGPDHISHFIGDLYENGFSAAFKHEGDAVYIYYVFTVIIFRALVAIEVLAAIGYMLWFMVREKMGIGDLYRFCFKGSRCSVLELQMFNFILPALLVLAKTVLYTSLLQEHVWISAVISALVTLCILNCSFTALFVARRSVTLKNMRQVMVYNYNSGNKAGIVEFTQEDLLDEADEAGLRRLKDKISGRLPKESAREEGNSDAVTEQLFATMAGTWDEGSLLSRFQNLMLKEKIFLQPSISLVEIADKLHTNKTYVSKLVNQTYNMGFPELLNTLRIDYARQYILNHRQAKQNEIAEACGFLSASTFNSIFKKVTGVTPKMWMASVHNK